MDEALPGFGSLPITSKQEALWDTHASTRHITGEVEAPVAHVHVEAPVIHMDRTFDYLIPARLDSSAVIGARVHVDVGSQRMNGFIVGRDSVTERSGKLRELRRVISPIAVLTPQIYHLARRLASQRAGSLSDVLRLAIPGRHARAEAAFRESVRPVHSPPQPPVPGRWEAYSGGGDFIRELACGASPSACCVALPGVAGSTSLLAVAAQAVLASGRQVVLTFPTARHAERMAAALEKLFPSRVALLLSESTQEKRYTQFLRALSGDAQIVVGTRASIWAPVPALGLLIVVDDASPHMREQRAPYCHVRDVAVERAKIEGAGVLLFSAYLSEASAHMCARGHVSLLRGIEAAVASSAPRISSPQEWRGEESSWARLPDAAFSLVRTSLDRGPVLVVVPRAGYIPHLTCEACRRQAECPICGGRLAIDGPTSQPTCTRCGWHGIFRCPECGGAKLRSARIGSHRTAEEIGKAFPGVGIILSGARAAEGIVETVDSRPRIVVATPGAEPVAEGGFAAGLILDTPYLRGEGLGGNTQFLRLLSRALTRVRPARAGGHVLLAGGVEEEIVRALNRWDHVSLAELLLSEREALLLPPTQRWLEIRGEVEDLRRFLGVARSLLQQSRVAHCAEELSGSGAHTHSHIAHEPEDREVSASGQSLLSGGIRLLSPHVALLGPSRRDKGQAVYLRYSHEDSQWIGPALCAAHRQYSATGMGGSLRFELDPEL